MIVKRTKPRFWSHTGQKHHLVARWSKTAFRNFGLPKMGKKSCRETFGTIGVNVRSLARSKFRKWDPWSHHQRTEPSFWSHAGQNHRLVAVALCNQSAGVTLCRVPPPHITTEDRDIIKGRITEPNMLSEVNINVPRQNSRSRKEFCLPVMRASILRLSILGRASEICNSISSDPNLDIHHQSREEVKRTVKPRLRRNANRTRSRHVKTMRTFDVDVFLRRGKQHLAVR